MMFPMQTPARPLSSDREQRRQLAPPPRAQENYPTLLKLPVQSFKWLQLRLKLWGYRGLGRCHPFLTFEDDHRPQQYAATQDPTWQDQMPTTARMCNRWHQSHHGDRSCVTSLLFYLICTRIIDLPSLQSLHYYHSWMACTILYQ